MNENIKIVFGGENLAVVTDRVLRAALVEAGHDGVFESIPDYHRSVASIKNTHGDSIGQLRAAMVVVKQAIGMPRSEDNTNAIAIGSLQTNAGAMIADAYNAATGQFTQMPREKITSKQGTTIATNLYNQARRALAMTV